MIQTSLSGVCDLRRWLKLFKHVIPKEKKILHNLDKIMIIWRSLEIFQYNYFNPESFVINWCCTKQNTLRVHFFTKIQDQTKNLDHEDFSLRKEQWSKFKKGLFFIHFHRNDPQYWGYPGERITRLLTMLKVCWSFTVFWAISSKILL